MRTPREILLARHAGAADGLDAMREKIVAGIVTGLAPAPEKIAARQPATFMEFLVSLRWHAAAMSAAWLVIAMLGRGDPGNARGTLAGGADSPPPLAYIFALREYRRELAELIDPPAAREPLPVPHACVPPRRRETDCPEIA